MSLALKLSVQLFEPFQTSFSFHDVFIVPLYLPRYFQPTHKVIDIDLPYLGIENGGILEFFPFCGQFIFSEACPAPKYQAQAFFLFAVAHNRVSVQKPNGVSMPDFVLRFRQFAINGGGKNITDFFVGCSCSLLYAWISG